jgi:hypothetical protein
MTGVEPANGGVTIHCLNHLATPARYMKSFVPTLDQSFYSTRADSGNRTRTSCLEGKGTTTMQYPHCVSKVFGNIFILMENEGFVNIFFKEFEKNTTFGFTSGILNIVKYYTNYSQY